MSEWERRQFLFTQNPFISEEFAKSDTTN